MLLEYIQAALRHAKHEILPDDGTYYGEVPECNGVYANAEVLEDCREELREVIRWDPSGLSRAGCAPMEICNTFAPLVFKESIPEHPKAALNRVEALSALERFNRQAPGVRPENNLDYKATLKKCCRSK